jgi:hypothetical protein
MTMPHRQLLVVGLLLWGITSWSFAQKPKAVVKRAQPPKFEKSDPFFANAFEGGLSGSRPADLGKAVMAAVGPAVGATPNGSSGGSSSVGGWAALISSTVLEDEIKAQKLGAEKSITTPTDFTSNGYKFARREFSVAAMVFAIIAEYDGEVRFKKEALTLRDNFARTAANAKVGTTGVYNESKVRKTDLENLLSGQGVELRTDVDPKSNWVQICNRTPLMQRLDLSRDEKIKAWSAGKAEFTANLEALEHEAQVFAVIGAVLAKEGMESADDAEYVKWAKMLQEGGTGLAKACRDKNLDDAGKAVVLITNSCEKCHEGYR